MADAFKAPSMMRWKHIHIPNLLPFIFASSRLAIALSWKVALVAEIFGATAGVGYVINNFFQRLQADMIIAWALPVMLLMFGVERVMRRIAERSFDWRPELDDALGEAA
jgi:NitT/TauT family transport system permease protein